MLKALLKKFKQIQYFFYKEIWITNLNSFGKIRGSFYKLIKIIMIAVSGFWKDNCSLRAAALTYSLLMAIVPLFAVVFSVLKGFGFQNKLADFMLNKLTGGSTLVVTSIQSYITNTNVHTLGALGGMILIVTSVFLFMGIERAFNDIWKIKTERRIVRRVMDYIVIIMVLPIFLTVAMGVTISNVMTLSFIHKLLSNKSIHLIFNTLTPYVFIWIAFTLMYMFLINMKVRLFPAFIGGVIAGTTWQLGQILYIHLTKWASQNIIYGSFAQPILVIFWAYVSWNIILAGMEIVYAIVTCNSYQRSGKFIDISIAFKEKLTLIILAIILRRFKQAEPPFSTEQIIKMTNAPMRATLDIISELKETMIIIESTIKNKKVYSPAIHIDKMTVPYILKIQREYGINKLPLINLDDESKVDILMKNMEISLEKDFGNVRLADL